MAEFQQGYVLQLLQEARNYIDEADDPREAIQESPVIMGLIQQLLQLALKDQEGPETATTTSGQEDDTTNPNSSSGGDVPRPRTATPPPPHITTPLSDAPPRVFDPVDPDPAWIPKVIVPASNSEELLVSAECSVCGMDGVKGTFFRRGFTCSRCIGHHRLLNRSEPGATSASRLTMMEGHHYYASRCPTKECNGFTSSSSSTSPTTSTSSSPSALPTTSTTALPDNVAYLVSFVPHPSEDNATRNGLEVSAAFRRRTLEQLRLIAHPSMLFLFSCGEDKTRRRTFFVHEAATPLAQLVLTQRNDANTDPLVDVGSYSFFNPGTGDGEEPTSALSPASSPSPATPPRADSSSTLDLSVGTLIQTHVGLRVPGQHVEWVRKVAFAGLDALEHLHSHHMHHGHCTPSHLYVDDHGTIKLKATIVGGLDWQHHVHVNGESRFLPPEAATNQRHGQLLPTSVAVDLFMLGGTLVELLLRPFVGTCGDSEASDDDDRPKFEDLTPVEMLKRAQASCRSDNSVSGSLEVFFSFLEGLVHTTPSERPSSAKSALRHPVFTSLRVVNGIPAETMGATITVRHEGDAGAGDVSGGDSAVGSSYDLRRNRTVSWRADTKPLIDTNEVHSAGLLWFHRGDADSQSQLSKFLAEHGPKFQLVRSARSSMTLYSLKSDPRRRRAASVTDRVGSPMLFASSATSVASH
ncbi:Hypothetical protein, putative [Bodo saltans]|uniref:Protein kinase domain-containing protein n=1 Tax=Bodo saltans TaxID=75058 RepID=A0A0S4JUX0_BODSA|nr:Hypothetical protein, putative [Bodo saltans]|eukprot:CUG92903.1 Hypothetical protein, putative [Bodo saltans]